MTRDTGRRPEETPGDAEQVLAATVDRLRDEVDGLRGAMRSRALIEQAKGMLMERYGCTGEDAFARLATLSQHANVKLADVATALVATSSPGAGSATDRPAQQPAVARPTPRAAEAAARRTSVERWPRQVSGDSAFGTQLRRRGRRTRTRSELLGARSPDDVIRVILRTALEEHRPGAIALATVDVGGALVMLGSHGIPPDVAARWQRVPVDLPLPVCLTARSGQGRWWRDSDPDGPGSLGFGLPDRWQVAAVLPLPRSGGHRGVLAMTWADGEHAPAPDDRAEIEAVAQAVAVTVLRFSEAATSPQTPGAGSGRRMDPVLALLDVLWQPILLCDPVIGQDRTVQDLRVRHANPAAAGVSGREELIGRGLIELFPDAVTTGLFTACLRVWETGEHLDLRDHRSRLTDPQGAAPADVLATRYQDGVLITWRRHPVTDEADG